MALGLKFKYHSALFLEGAHRSANSTTGCSTIDKESVRLENECPKPFCIERSYQI